MTQSGRYTNGSPRTPFIELIFLGKPEDDEGVRTVDISLRLTKGTPASGRVGLAPQWLAWALNSSDWPEADSPLLATHI
jgi:hypothetical protein